MGHTKPFTKDDMQVIFIDLQNLCEAITEIVLKDAKGKLGQRAWGLKKFCEVQHVTITYYEIVESYKKSQQGIRGEVI